MFADQYAKYYELLNHKKQYKHEVKFVWNWARSPKTVLDLACGTANYWKYYPEKVEVFGIEQSKSMIELSPYKDRIFCQDVKKIDPFFCQKQFDLVTSMFDAMNYIDCHKWWKNIPIKSGGYFIFDMWDKVKVAKEGFRCTVRRFGGICRTITPVDFDSESVRLKIDLYDGKTTVTEIHEMFLYDIDDILEFSGDDFEVVDVKQTKTWQTWYKLKRK